MIRREMGTLKVLGGDVHVEHVQPSPGETFTEYTQVGITSVGGATVHVSLGGREVGYLNRMLMGKPLGSLRIV